MIVYGIAVTNGETYERCAVPGLERVAEPDSEVIRHATAGSLFRNYNILMDKAAEHPDLEALVLPHQDVEIVDEDFPERIRKVMSDPDVAIVGCAGAVGVRSIAWWQGAVTWASITHRYTEHTGGEFPGPSWDPDALPAHAEPGEVDSIDGLIIVMSPWAVRNLRFDESLGKLHGYDFDICMQAKDAAKKVYAADFRVIHHRDLDLIRDPESWIDAHVTLAEKWAHLMPDTGSDPDRRALRAEAEAACARALMVGHQYRSVALSRHLNKANLALGEAREELDRLRRELAEVRDQTSP